MPVTYICSDLAGSQQQANALPPELKLCNLQLDQASFWILGDSKRPSLMFFRDSLLNLFLGGPSLAERRDCSHRRGA